MKEFSLPPDLVPHPADIDLQPKARVLVALSGGVDSAATCATMVALGFDVVAMTLQLHDHGVATKRTGACCSSADLADARSVARKLGIPHYTLDSEEAFRNAVIEPFADAFVQGKTPLPCSACNHEVKFPTLIRAAHAIGAQAVITGHYARRIQPPNGHPQLLRAHDHRRDQSHFLAGLSRNTLKHIRFPLGGLRKDDARAIARLAHLPVADKPDSQDLCFVPDGKTGNVVAALRPEAHTPGIIRDSKTGAALGRHDGVFRFTIGQRRGIGVDGPTPRYVLAIDPAKAEIIVGPREDLATPELWLANLNWLGDDPTCALPPEGMPVLARTRAGGTCVPATLLDGLRVRFAEPVMGIAPGQVCSLLCPKSEERTLGGGVIRAAPNSAQRAS